MATLPWWGYTIFVLVTTHLMIISVTLFLHRNQSHRAFTLHKAVSHFFRGWLWLTTGIVTRQWVAVHRKHHATVETNDDPHSPQLLGIHRVLWLGLPLYRRAAADRGTLDKYGSGTPDDWIERNIYARFPNTGIALLLILELLAFGPLAGTLVWLVPMIWIPFWAAGVINGLGHFLGYRNYELEDASRNIVPWGIIIGGEELHNNHHAFAGSARFSAKPWEIDLGWFYIRMLERLSLANAPRQPPVLITRSDTICCDIETLRALIGNRFEIMADYAREVVTTVCQDEARAIRNISRSKFRMFRNASKLILRENTQLNPHAQQRLTYALILSPRISTVYDAKLRLQEIWIIGHRLTRTICRKAKRIPTATRLIPSLGLDSKKPSRGGLLGVSIDNFT